MKLQGLFSFREVTIHLAKEEAMVPHDISTDTLKKMFLHVTYSLF